MPYQIGELVNFDVTFRHASNGVLFDPPTNHQIAIIKPDGTVDTDDATQIGSIVGLYRRTFTVDSAGNWAWYPATTDEDITPTQIAEIEVGQAWTERIEDLPTTSEVNDQIVDVLTTDVYPEPASVPAASSSIAAKLGLLFAMARNKHTQTAGAAAVRNDADNADIGTRTVSDDGTTLTVGELQ